MFTFSKTPSNGNNYRNENPKEEKWLRIFIYE